MAIPDFDPRTGYLPPGLHEATLGDIQWRLGSTTRRRWLVANLAEVARLLFDAGVRDLRIDGSFVTEKPDPGDIDGFWIVDAEVRFEEIPSVLLDFSLVPDPGSGKPKFPMWHRYGLELFLHPMMGGFAPGDLPTFFSHSRDGVERGYLRVVPEEVR
jgi:hypothetical protein